MTFLLIPAKMTQSLMFIAELQHITYHTAYCHSESVFFVAFGIFCCSSWKYARFKNNDRCQINVLILVLNYFFSIIITHTCNFNTRIADKQIVFKNIGRNCTDVLLTSVLCFNCADAEQIMIYVLLETFGTLIDLMRQFFT